MIKHFQQFPRPHKVAISVLSVLVGLLSLAPSESAQAGRAQPTTVILEQVGERQPLTLSLDLVDTATTQAPVLVQERTVQVRSGDTLSAIFSRNGLPSTLLHDINQLNGVASELAKLYPGKILTFGFDAEHQFKSLHYPLDNSRSLHINYTSEGLSSHIEQAELEKRTEFAQATVSSNFWNAAAGAGLSPNQIMSLAGMFAWDVDFALDIRTNDNFTVLYEQYFKDGILVSTGNILAASFTNQGKVYQAIRHQDGNYYSPEGRYMRKSFLRAPVNFSHISSNFNPRRLHPVTGQVKPHRGIDYAARTGTPVVAAGNGVVVESGFSRFNGNYVVIRHDSTYTTKYLHLHQRKVNKGEKVKQEQQIGTVGATGRVTGPHLHYEFLVNGIHKDPKSVDLPQAAFLSPAELAVFKPKAKRLMAQLSKVSDIMLARNP
ncbi:peptidoglycan DD-metalloendopeptidase family protein [Oceanisphaera avium]|uniref:Peptidase M23 n=1 Tax=Oceanisphaera avium TaxID=1903694 RepID=A0A1Y0CZA9_9GAMM|nr:peptidoglycan DD-metalloendopeptidase family protein [Oceanisphaera avium]ART80237.1 peptidase M23 [Oceanisphaera avium]